MEQPNCKFKRKSDKSACHVHNQSAKTNQPVTVTFEALGGSCSTTSKQVSVGSPYGTLPIPTKTNYTFVGWWYDSGIEVIEKTHATIVTKTTNHTLYAHWASTYKITNVGAAKCLNIYGDNLTSLYNGINVTLWSDSGSNEQKWLFSGFGMRKNLRSVIDKNYGLNVYTAGNPYNCNIHLIRGNEYDAVVNITSCGSYFKFKLYNYDLYLTVGSSSNGTNVYWSAESNSAYQQWYITEI